MDNEKEIKDSGFNLFYTSAFLDYSYQDYFRVIENFIKNSTHYGLMIVEIDVDYNKELNVDFLISLTTYNTNNEANKFEDMLINLDENNHFIYKMELSSETTSFQYNISYIKDNDKVLLYSSIYYHLLILNVFQLQILILILLFLIQILLAKLS